MNKTFNRFMMAWLSLTYIFLFVPIVVIIVMSFNKTDYGLFPYVFTTDWYTYLFSKSELLPATELSIIFSLIIALFSIILGTLTALGLQQRPRSKRDAKVAIKEQLDRLWQVAQLLWR